MSSHVIRVAFEVEAESWESAQRILMSYLPRPHSSRIESPIECWWIAEDERYDGSDNDSVVFVPYNPP